MKDLLITFSIILLFFLVLIVFTYFSILEDKKYYRYLK
jgi:CHASE3 domain sensor protein